MALTPKQVRFVDEYLIDLNATQAYIRAGYAPKDAHVSSSQLLANPSIQALVAEKQRALAEKSGISHQWITEHFTEIAQRCMEAVPVRDKKGNIIEGEWQFEPTNANRAIENLGKHLGYYPKEKAETPSVQVNVVLAWGNQ